MTDALTYLVDRATPRGWDAGVVRSVLRASGAAEELERLRGRVHDIADAGQDRVRRLESSVAVMKARYDEARRITRDWKVDWMTDPPSQAPGGWYLYTSSSNLDEVVALIGRAEEAEARATACIAALHQAYVAADFDLSRTIRRALIAVGEDPEA